jgi:hypothetical protein
MPTAGNESGTKKPYKAPSRGPKKPTNPFTGKTEPNPFDNANKPKGYTPPSYNVLKPITQDDYKANGGKYTKNPIAKPKSKRGYTEAQLQAAKRRKAAAARVGNKTSTSTSGKPSGSSGGGKGTSGGAKSGTSGSGSKSTTKSTKTDFKSAGGSGSSRN